MPHVIQSRGEGQFSLDDIAKAEDGGHASPLAPISSPFSPEMSVAAARAVLVDLLEAGAACPCCSQTARIWRRKVNSQMARTLIALYRAAALSFAYLPDIRREVGADNREESKLVYWGLIEEEDDVVREDGGRAGFWRVTSAGEAFVLGHGMIPKYARVYRSQLLGLYGDQVTIRDALGTRFDYDDLMAGL